mgnify:CR=1 FL=1
MVNEFYVGCMHELYTRWKSGKKTMAQSGFVLKEVAEYCKRNPSK